MPVQEYSIAEIMPEILSGLITEVSDVYQETHGLSEMAEEARPQLNPKIRVRGKVFLRQVADDIPEASAAKMIKDTDFTDEMFTAPTYGRAFPVTANDLILNPEYLVNFRNPAELQIRRADAAMFIETVRNASVQCIQQIVRSQDKQVHDIIKYGTVPLTNYTTIDFGRDTNNSETISVANRKWTVANAATMRPYLDMASWTEQVADRGNSGNIEYATIMGREAFRAYQNCDDYKDDSNMRRNYKVEMMDGISSASNKNIPAGAVYRESVRKNVVGINHIFTYNQTYTDSSGDPQQWIGDNDVFVIAFDNVIRRQAVQIRTMDAFFAKSPELRRLINSIPVTRGWLAVPEYAKFNMQSIAFGIYKKYLTQMLTPNKTFAAIVNS